MADDSIYDRVMEASGLDDWQAELAAKLADPANQKVLAAMNKPLGFWRAARALGLGGVGRLLGILALFVLTNVGLFLAALYFLFSHGWSLNGTGVAALIGCLGFVFTAYAAYRGYHFIKDQVLQAIYDRFAFLLRRLCDHLVDKTARAMGAGVPHSGLSKALEVGAMLDEKFQQVPESLRKLFKALLRRVPVVGFLTDLNPAFLRDAASGAQEQLFQRLDSYVRERILDDARPTWFWWWYPLNLAVQGGLIYAFLY